MRDIIKPALTLFVVCLVVSLSLAFTYSATKGKIEEITRLDAEKAKKAVLTDIDAFYEIEGSSELIKSKPEFEPVKEIYAGKKGNAVAGYVFKTVTKGYGGAIEVIVGVDIHGKVTGIKMGSNNETPGLGSKASEGPFKSQLVNIMPKEKLQVVKAKKTKVEEIEAISGATITSKAVVEAVQASLDVSKELIKKEGGKK